MKIVLPTGEVTHRDETKDLLSKHELKIYSPIRFDYMSRFGELVAYDQWRSFDEIHIVPKMGFKLVSDGVTKEYKYFDDKVGIYSPLIAIIKSEGEVETYRVHPIKTIQAIMELGDYLKDMPTLEIRLYQEQRFYRTT